jgi:putative transposase
MIGLSRRTYYPRPRAAADAAVDPDAALRHAITDVRRAFPGHGYRRRVTHELRRRDQPVNHKRVRRAMRAMLLPPAPLRRPWLVAEPDAVTGTWYPNLRAGMVPTACSELWVAEITYVRLERAFVFLAVVLDVFSRKIVGYAIGPTLDARLSLAALDAAIDSRQPPPACVHHSDRGSQYASKRYRERLVDAGLLGSMSRAGNPYDNAHAESFMKTLKHEEIYPRGYRTMADVIAHLPHFLETIYNNDRLHSALGYRTPNEYEADHVLTLSSGQIAAS